MVCLSFLRNGVLHSECWMDDLWMSIRIGTREEVNYGFRWVEVEFPTCMAPLHKCKRLCTHTGRSNMVSDGNSFFEKVKGSLTKFFKNRKIEKVKGALTKFFKKRKM